MAGAGPRQGADMEDEEPDGDAVRGGLLPGVPAEGEHEGRRARAGGESRRAAGVLGAAGVPGALIPVLIGSLEDAAKATEAGVDGIVVQGCEAEGLVIGQVPSY